MRKTFQFRIYPTKNQEVKLISTLNTCRHLYNDALAERKDQAKFKAEYAGRVVELVNPRNTSKELSQRTYNCPECGNIMDRDHNAAVNILQRIGQDMSKSTPVEMVA